jgi:hypothetical protein
MRTCKRCGAEYQPIPSQVRRGWWRCRKCITAINREYELRRKAEGRPLVRKPVPYRYHYSPRTNTELYRALKRGWDAKYRNDPAYAQRLWCRQQFNNEVIAGRIKRQACSQCGKPTAEGHHPDYEKPFDVIWLCRKCHAALHRALRRDANVGTDTPSDRVRKPDQKGATQ